MDLLRLDPTPLPAATPGGRHGPPLPPTALGSREGGPSFAETLERNRERREAAEPKRAAPPRHGGGDEGPEMRRRPGPAAERPGAPAELPEPPRAEPMPAPARLRPQAGGPGAPRERDREPVAEAPSERPAVDEAPSPGRRKAGATGDDAAADLAALLAGTGTPRSAEAGLSGAADAAAEALAASTATTAGTSADAAAAAGTPSSATARTDPLPAGLDPLAAGADPSARRGATEPLASAQAEAVPGAAAAAPAEAQGAAAATGSASKPVSQLAGAATASTFGTAPAVVASGDAGAAPATAATFAISDMRSAVGGTSATPVAAGDLDAGASAATTAPTPAPTPAPALAGSAPAAPTTPGFHAPGSAEPPVLQGRIAAHPASAQFVPQLGAQLEMFIREGVQNARLQLHPAELGPVAVQIQLEGGQAQVALAAEVASTREKLLEALPQLARQLEQNGLAWAGGSVGSQLADTRREGQGDHRDSAGASARAERSGPAVGSDTGAAPALPRRSRGIVDLVA
jgi:flagellar hook-length control protein FliK